MDSQTLRMKHPAAFGLWCYIKNTPEDAPPTAPEIGWTEAKFRAALERLQALGLVQVETVRQRRRITALEAVPSASDKLRAVEAKAERWRPLRVEGAELVMNDGSKWPLPEEMRDPEMYDAWTQFAVLMDQKLERVNINFTTAEYFRQMGRLITAGKKSFSYNQSYVYNAYTEYIKTSKYNIVTANKLADKVEQTPTPEAPKKAAPVDRKSREKHVVGVLESAFMEAGMSADDAKSLTRGNWEKYEQRMARIQGGFPTDDEITAAALACAAGGKSHCTPPKVGNRIMNARNPDCFKKTAAAPVATPGESMREKFKKADRENPHFRAELADACRLTTPDFDKLNPLEQGDAIFQLFKAMQLAEVTQ